MCLWREIGVLVFGGKKLRFYPNYGKIWLNLIKKYLFKYKVVFYTVLNSIIIVENQ